MKKKITQYLYILSLFVVFGCDYYRSNLNDHNADVNPQVEQAGEFEVDQDQIDFQQIKEKILDSNCINCHTGKHNNFDQYVIVKLAINDILIRIRSKSFFNRMPKGRDPLPEDLITLFEKWVSLGAPEFTDTAPAEKAFDDNFEDIKKKVLKPNKCLECHQNFESYDEVVTNIDKIVKSIENATMPMAMNSEEVSIVTEDQYNAIINWINSGFKEF